MMAAGFFLAEAFVKVKSDDTGLAAAMRAQTKAAAAGLTATATVQLAGDLAKAQGVKLKAQLDAMFKEVSANLNLNDKNAQVALLSFGARADRLQRKLEMNLTLDGVAKAQLELLKLDVLAGRLKAKFGGPTGVRGFLSGLLPTFLGGGASGAIAGGGQAAAGGGLAASLGGTGVAAGAAAGLAALLGGAGGVVPLLAAATLGVAAFGATAIPTLISLRAAMASVSTANDNFGQAAGLVDTAIKASALDAKVYRDNLAALPPGLRSAEKLLGNTGVTWQGLTKTQRDNVIALSQNKDALKVMLPAQRTALTALLSSKKAWDSLTPAQQAASRSVSALSAGFGNMVTALEPLTLKVLNDGLKVANTLLPFLLPLAKAGGKALDGLVQGFEGFAKSAGFKSFMAEMTKLSGPAIHAIGQGFGQIVAALGKLVLALINPNGIRALKGILDLTAWSIQGLAWFITKATPIMITAFHDVAIGFDKSRHAIAATVHQVSDDIDFVRVTWVNTGHGIERVSNAIVATFDGFRHHVANVFDGIRSDIANIWNTVWNNTVSRTARGIADLMGWIDGIRGRILGAVGGAANWIVGTGRSVIFGFWHGAEAVWTTVEGWFKGLPSKILHALGIASPPPWAIDAGQHVMSGLLKGMTHGASSVSGFFRGLASDASGIFKSIWSALGGGGKLASSGLVRQEELYAASRFPAHGWGPEQLAPLIALWTRESGWNPYAVNPSSGAAGIAQSLGHGPVTLGDWAGQINWGEGYIAQRYGDPAAAWNHETAFGWYDDANIRKRYLPRGLSLALNTTGRPEPVGVAAAAVSDPAILARLDRVVRLLESAPAATGLALTDSLNGTARISAATGQYTTRFG